MRQILFSACILGFALLACKKEIAPEEPSVVSDKKIAVQFNVSDFLRQQEVLPTPGGRKYQTAQGRDSLLSEKVSNVYYFAFEKSSGNKVHLKHQTPANSGLNFGLIKDTLLPGSYTILMVASIDSLRIISDGEIMGSGPELGTLRASYNWDNQDFLYPLKDQFFKKFDLIVPSSGEVPQANISLDRYMSKIEVRVNDAAALEADNKDIEVIAFGAHNNFHYNSASPSWGGLNLRFSKSSGNTYTAYALPSAAPHYEVKVIVKERGTGTVLNTKVIPNVTATKNKATILSGNALSVTPTEEKPEWHIQLNVIWEASSPVIDF
ncbi:FimB/Mfa2 family fimbrial subunit [Chitinophaga deserti]|uniref:FimB/Mfa2 family fimbrial subunit n=1 Tax=Chitinophaga deserti TaxID=2164099 RepID=UPI000D6BD2DD|nr:FimB/Mfa2 family fimbrial subunit [Chitinophaga deserti]